MWLQCRLRARRSRHPVWFSGLDPYAPRLFRFSESLDDICTVDDDHFKLFAIFLWEYSFLILLHYFSPQHWEIGDPLPSLTSERHCPLWEALFITQSCCPIALIRFCKLVLQLFLICTFNFSALLLLPVPIFGMCSSHEIQNEPIFGITFQNVSLSTFDMLSIFYFE